MPINRRNPLAEISERMRNPYSAGASPYAAQMEAMRGGLQQGLMAPSAGQTVGPMGEVFGGVGPPAMGFGGGNTMPYGT